jgi:hypothetical protein
VESLEHPGLLHEAAAFEEHAERDQRVVAEAPAEILHSARGIERGLEVGAHELGRPQVQRIAVFGALGRVGEQALGTREPRVRLRRFTADAVVQPRA